jgi:transcriptional regulator with XRE-family HTH domain
MGIVPPIPRGGILAKSASENIGGIDAAFSAAYLSGVERGVRNPTVMVLAKIAKALGVEADELLRNPRPKAK